MATGTLFGIFFFVLGLGIGSFLNVIIVRYNTGLTTRGRSKCMVCSTQLRWYELIPVGSFLMLGGRCRHCKSNISRQYPLVELATGLILALTYLHFRIFDALPLVVALSFHLVVFSLLIVIVVYDMRHKIIPDPFVYSFILLSLVSTFINLQSLSFVLPSLSQLLAGPLIALPFALLWLVSKGRWMGFGDVKLALGIGWLLGLAGGTVALLFSFWIGAVVSVGIILAGKILPHLRGSSLSLKSEMPFAPFLVLGTLLVFFLDINFFSLLYVL